MVPVGACFSFELFGIEGHDWPQIFLLPLVLRAMWGVLAAWNWQQKRLDNQANDKANRVIMEYEVELHLQQVVDNMSPDGQREWHIPRLCAGTEVYPCSDWHAREGLYISPVSFFAGSAGIQKIETGNTGIHIFCCHS
jgi:hypothetical protein